VSESQPRGHRFLLDPRLAGPVFVLCGDQLRLDLDASEKNVAMENKVVPIRALLGKLYLATQMPKEALAEFEASQKTSPERISPGRTSSGRTSPGRPDTAAHARSCDQHPWHFG
jgi:hypothetical protein